MRFLAWLLLCALFAAGCAGPKAESGQGGLNTPATQAVQHPKIIVTPDKSKVGRVVRVNNDARFAVINFPIGSVPAEGRTMSAYRQGLKVGEIKVTGPGGDEYTVADIKNGDVQVGDEVRGN